MTSEIVDSWCFHVAQSRGLVRSLVTLYSTMSHGPPQGIGTVVRRLSEQGPTRARGSNVSRRVAYLRVCARAWRWFWRNTSAVENQESATEVADEVAFGLSGGLARRKGVDRRPSMALVHSNDCPHSQARSRRAVTRCDLSETDAADEHDVAAFGKEAQAEQVLDMETFEYDTDTNAS